MPQNESQVWNANGDVTEGYWIIQVFVLSANFQKKLLLHCFFVPFDVMGSNLKEPQRRRIILYGFLFIGLKHFQCLFKRTKGSQKMFNFAVSIVRFQLIKAKSLPSWQAMLWAFIMRGQQHADYPWFPKGCWQGAAFLASRILTPPASVGDRCWCSWEAGTEHRAGSGACAAVQRAELPSYSCTRCWEGLCSCEVWALNFPHLWHSAAGRQLDCDLGAPPRWQMVLVFCY